MRTTDAMTILLVVTLFTNLAHHKLRSVSASGDAEELSINSKRRFLEQLTRFRLPSDRQPSYTKVEPLQILYPTTPKFSSVERTPNQLSSSFLQWFHSNKLPMKERLEAQNGGEEKEELSAVTNWSSLPLEGRPNLFIPDTPAGENQIPPILQQYELSDIEDSFLHRRHAQSRNNKQKRKEERERRKEEKKKKRNKERKKRKKESKRMQDLLKNEDVILHNIDGVDYFDCCPSKLVVVEKQVGKDRNNHAVEVRPSQQYFYERVCLQEIEERECVFPASSLRKGVVTRCAQQFSYVQAQVRPYRSEVEWHLDYIYVRSGCSCQVSTTVLKKGGTKKRSEG